MLRHQLLVLQRQVGKPAFNDSDRAVLAGLLHHLPKDRLRHLLLLVRLDTVLAGIVTCSGGAMPRPAQAL